MEHSLPDPGPADLPAELAFLHGTGEMAALIRAHDWVKTPLGAPDTWPQSLRTAIRLLLNTGHPIYVFWGREGYCFYNDAYRLSIGSERHPSSLGKPAREVWEEIWDFIGPQIEQVMAGRGATWHENQLVPITRNGVREDVYWTYSYGPIDEESAPNAVGGVLVICTETTQTVLGEKKRLAATAEQIRTLSALKEHEEQLRLATDAAEVGLWDVDLCSDSLYWPARVKSMFGISPDVAVSMQDFYAGLHPADREHVTAAFALASDSSRRALYDVEYRTIGKEDGVVRWVAAKGAGIFVGDVCIRVIGTAIDVSERKAAEQRLRESEAQLRLLDLLGSATRSAVDARQILRQTTRLLGEYLGVQRCAYADMEPDENTFTIRDDWTDGVPSSRGVYTLDAFGPRAVADLHAGRPLVVNDVDAELTPREGGDTFNSIAIKAVICYPLVRAGRLLALMAVHRTAPHVWTASEIALVGTIVERSWAHIERARSAQKLIEADQRKDEFLATLAHELRNPLAPIRQAAGVLRSTKATEAQRSWSTGVIERQATHMALLLDDLLEVSRITRGKLLLRKEVVDLTAVIDTAVETASALIEAQDHRLIRRVPAGPLFIEVDALRFAQVVSNLLTNAAKYTDKGGEIILDASLEQDNLVVSVSDNGIGIASDMLPRVFEMFSQVAGALEGSRAGGLGIGLALVQGLVELHGGRVAAESNGLGCGSRFTVSIPMRNRVAAVQQPAAGRDVFASGKALRIVVADDNRDAALSLAALLELDGHEVRVVFDGEEAVRAADEFAPDVMLLDIGMPRINGYDVARQMRANSGVQPIALIALTGWGQPQDRARALAEGFDHHLTKPVDYDVLRGLLAPGARGRGSL